MGARVGAIRRARHLTLAQVLGSMGVPPSSTGFLSRVERGERGLSRRRAEELATALGVQVEHLTGQLPVLPVFREIAGLSAQQLAEHVGVSVGELSRFERGIARPPRSVAAHVAERLGVSVPVLFPPVGDESAA